ncbi:MAG: signal transduction histidine kinase [Planctomycetota bacterium]|nr:signal transduction histidine kinase [Planctomycetota bacterium]
MGRRGLRDESSTAAPRQFRGDRSRRQRGPGVPPELLSSIFEPFFRVEGHRSRESGGVGLGLAIARRAVGLHRGRIEAHNADPGLAVEIVMPAS